MTSAHNWVKSTLRHGETMCTRCFITNREAAVLGLLDKCEVGVAAHLTQDEIDDSMIDDDECGACGGSGYLEGECTCGEDTCCCLEPDAPMCSECNGTGSSRQALALASQAGAE